MTGAELRAWRERLGLTREDASRAIGNALARRESINAETVERLEGNRTFYGDPAPYVAAYRAALEADEARQAAERGPVEPVCPEGVTVREVGDRVCEVSLNEVPCFRVTTFGDPRVVALHAQAWPIYLARYAADLSEYRAALHAASDKQRKLDAVEKAREANDVARAEWEAADKKWRAAARALDAAKSEAGL